jgi:unspecific monooxygenase
VLILAELKLIIGAIYTNYATKIVEALDIEQVDDYTGGPKGNKVVLEFQRA